VSAVKEIIFL